MYIIHIYIIYSLLCYNIIFAEDYDKEEELHAKLELIDMDLEEMCEDMAISLRRSLLENPVNFTEKVYTYLPISKYNSEFFYINRIALLLEYNRK